MKRLIFAFLFSILSVSFVPFATQAQQVTRVCFTTNGTNCIPVDATNPFPVTGTFSSTTNEKSTAAAPSYIEGSSNPLSGNLSGNLRVIDPTVGSNGSAAKTFSSLIGVSDGTNQQQLIAPISLGDGVNGNNSISAGLYAYNGATWDRLRVDGSKNLNVNIAAGTLAVTQSGTWTVQPGNTANTTPWLVTANAGTNLNTSALALESGGNLATVAGSFVSQGTALGTIKNALTGGSVTTNAPSYTTGNINPLSLTTAGGLRIDLKDTASNTNNLNVAIAAGSAIVGKVGIDQTTDVTTNGIEIAPTAGAAAGITPVISASAEANHVLKGSAGNLYSVYVTTGATAGFLMVFNATSAPVDGAVTPIHCVQAPANQTVALSFNPGPAEAYSTGITASFSSTGCFTKTASATAFFHGSVK